MELSKFKHKCQVQVRTFDIDSQGIVHNSVYLKYLEIGRVEFRKSFGYKLNHNGTFNDGLRFVVVHNSLDYRSFAMLDDILNIYTRVSWIKNSSFCFEQIFENDVTKKIICEGKGILVNLDIVKNEPAELDKKFVDELLQYDKGINIIRE